MSLEEAVARMREALRKVIVDAEIIYPGIIDEARAILLEEETNPEAPDGK